MPNAIRPSEMPSPARLVVALLASGLSAGTALHVGEGRAEPKFTIVTFGSEGPPYDTGKDLRESMSSFREKAEGAGFDFEVYTPRRLNTTDDRWSIQSYPKECWGMNPTLCKVNFGAWKSVILESALEKAAPGDIILYTDGDANRSAHLHTLGTWRNTTEFALSQAGADIAMVWERNPGIGAKYGYGPGSTLLPSGSFTSPLAIRELGAPFPEEKYTQWPLLNSAHIAVRKSPLALDLIRQCKSAMRDHHEYMTNPPRENRTAGFRWSTGDQNVFNVVMRKAVLEGKLPEGWPGISVFRHWWNRDFFKIENVPRRNESTECKRWGTIPMNLTDGPVR